MIKLHAYCSAAFTLALSVLMFVYGDHAVKVCAANVLLWVALSQFLAQDESPYARMIALLLCYVALLFAIVGIFFFAI